MCTVGQYTPWAIKKGHLILDHNSHVSRWTGHFLRKYQLSWDLCDHTNLNRADTSARCVWGCSSWLWTSSFTAAMLPAVREEHGWSLPAVRSIEPYCAKPSQKVVQHSPFPVLVGKFPQQSSSKKNLLHSHGFWSKFHLQLVETSNVFLLGSEFELYSGEHAIW